MGLINRYLIKSHIAPFLFGTFTVVFLFFFQFLILNLDKLIGKGLDNWTIIQLISYQLPAFIVLAVPMGVLFGTIMAFGSMSANHEITIIKSSGGSLIRMMIPISILGIGLSLFVYWFNNEVLPDANHSGKILLRDITQKKPTFGLDKGQFSTQLEGFTILPRDIDSSTGLMRGLTIYDNRNAAGKNIINADSGYIRFDAQSEKMVMDLFHGEIIQYPESSVNNMKKINFEKYRLFTQALDFTLDRTKDNDDDRGDRELKIADMQKRVDIAYSNETRLAKQYKEELLRHIDYLYFRNTRRSANPLPYSERAVVVDLSKADRDERMTANAARIPSPNINGRIDGAKLQNKDVKSSDTGNLALAPTHKTTQDVIIELSTLHNKLYGNAQLINANREEQRKYQVEIHKKYAIPFACLVFVLVGCPLGVRTRGGNFGLSAGISLGFFILYWACLIAGEKLADRNVISPWFGMWLGNIIVGILGIFLTLKVNNENLNIGYWIKHKFKRKPAI